MWLVSENLFSRVIVKSRATEEHIETVTVVPQQPGQLLMHDAQCIARFVYFLLHPGRGAEYCDQSICVFVCAYGYLQNHVTDLRQILCMLVVAVTRSFSGFVAIRYVLSVL